MRKFEVEFWEDQVKHDAGGRVTHHPLNGLYLGHDERQASHGYFTFAGHDLAESSLLADVRVYYLWFRSNVEDESDREAWADPLRLAVLKALSDHGFAWYLSLVSSVPVTASGQGYLSLDDDLRQNWPADEPLAKVTVKSETPQALGGHFVPRSYFEVPNHSLDRVFSRYWPAAVPGYAIEGCLLQAGRIHALADWDKQPRDAGLLRRVMDETALVFYTFPAEPRHFVFLTSKVSYSELRSQLKFDHLIQLAEALGEAK